MKNQSHALALTEDQALVLFDWLGLFNKSPEQDRLDAAQKRALWDLEAELERTLVAPLQGDYDAQVRRAKERLGE